MFVSATQTKTTDFPVCMIRCNSDGFACFVSTSLYFPGNNYVTLIKKNNKPFIVSFLFDFNLLIFLNFQSLSTKSPLKRKFPKGRRRKGRFRKSSDDKKKRVSSVGEFEFIQKSVLTNLNINRCSLQESW